MSTFFDFSSDPRSGLIRHLREHSIRTDGPFELRSGAVSDWYIDARQTTYDGLGARLVGRSVLQVLDPSADAVGGMTMGADPIAVATAVVAGEQGVRDISAFSIRKADKGHGMRGRLVGPVGRGDRVAVLDDTVTTGGAMGEAIEVLLESGVEVVQAIALVDRSAGAAASLAAAFDVPFRAIVEPADLGVG